MFSSPSTTSKQQLMHPFDTSQELRQNIPVNNNMSNNNNVRNNNPPPPPSSWMMNHGPEHLNYMMQQQQQRPPVMGPPNGTPSPSRSMQHTFSTGSSPAPDEKNKGNNRPVIPSKRAAQNRAAQKAFRQRREHYIKELEEKAKKMDDWQDEMDSLKKENTNLREKVTSLEKKVAMLKKRLGEVDGEIVEDDDDDKEEIVEKKAQEGETMQIETRETTEEEGRGGEGEDEEFVRRQSESLSVSSNTSRVLGPLDRSNSISRQEAESPLNNNSSSRFESPHHQQKQTPTFNTSPQAPRTSINITTNTSTTPSNNHITNTSPQQHNTVCELEPTSTLLPMQQQSNTIGQAPINITPVSFTSHVSNIASIPMNINDPLLLQQQQQGIGSGGDFWMQQQGEGGGDLINDLDFDFDPFFEDDFGPTLGNDFLPSANSGQVLDDLFAMLQTRQRPQIPMMPTDEKNLDDNNRIND